MHRSLAPISFAVLILALAAWAGVWFLFSDISTRLTAHAEALSQTDVQSTERASAIALHALVADTVPGRAQLDADVNTDVVQIANQINAAGKAAGVQTTIGSASVVSASQAGGLPAQAGVNELEFVVQSTGSFKQVWRAAQLFETLPTPSSVSQLDFEQLPNSGKGAPLWQLTTHIDVLTSAQISS
ncbi:MAG TPA: hypothetical protein VG102_00580 [Candidatus Paceibacterota bacterium]|jgi:hypothetical protein|nr:hypothetical protein [Candidatus Paceibacterota bacterium]